MLKQSCRVPFNPQSDQEYSNLKGDNMMCAMKQLGMTAAIIGTMSAAPVLAQEIPADASNFYKSESVTVRQVTFPNQYNMNIAGNLFLPKNLDQKTKHAAIIVGHPMGAVKEQSANLYAVKMAEQGFVTLSVDLAFWGGSEGQPRNAVSPDLYAETFSAAADFLGTNPLVDRERIGVIGICGSGSFAISAAKIDPPPEGHSDNQHVRHGRGQPERTPAWHDLGAAKADPQGSGGTALCGIHGRRNPVHQRHRP